MGEKKIGEKGGGDHEKVRQKRERSKETSD
jgi:hypothetical protein